MPLEPLSRPSHHYHHCWETVIEVQNSERKDDRPNLFYYFLPYRSLVFTSTHRLFWDSLSTMHFSPPHSILHLFAINLTKNTLHLPFAYASLFLTHTLSAHFYNTMLSLAIGDLYIPERIIELPPKFCKLLAPNPASVPSNSKISQVLCLGNVTNSLETLRFLHNLSPALHLVRGEYDDVTILSQQLAALSKTSSPTVPFHRVVSLDGLRVGFTNGYQVVPKSDPLALLTLARELDVDILIWGGTHKVEAYTLDGKFFINPGSATGAYTLNWPDNEDDEDADEDEDVDITRNEDDEEEPKNDKITHTEEADDENKQQAEAKEGASESDALDEDAANEILELTSPVPSFCLLDTNGVKCTLFIYTYIDGEVRVDKVAYQKE